MDHGEILLGGQARPRTTGDRNDDASSLTNPRIIGTPRPSSRVAQVQEIPSLLELLG